MSLSVRARELVEVELLRQELASPQVDFAKKAGGALEKRLAEVAAYNRGGRPTCRERVTASLGEKVEQLRKAPIIGPIPCLLLDATFLDARWARKVENVSVLVGHGWRRAPARLPRVPSGLGRA